MAFRVAADAKAVYDSRPRRPFSSRDAMAGASGRAPMSCAAGRSLLYLIDAYGGGRLALQTAGTRRGLERRERKAVSARICSTTDPQRPAHEKRGTKTPTTFLSR
jgi:hypothetical protein